MKHLLLLFICTVSLTVWGQVNTLPYTQTFDGPGPGLPTDWTSVDNEENLPPQVWTVGTIILDTELGWDRIPDLDGNYAYLNSADFGEGSLQDADLISPTFNLSGYNGSDIILHFDHFYYQFSVAESATLSYSIDGGTNWNVVKTWDYSSSNVETFNQIIPNIDGQSDVRFKWNYVGSWAYGWAVDNVSVSILNSRMWSGMVDNNWSTPGNWAENAVPDPSSQVYIDGMISLTSPVIQDNADCYNITIFPWVTDPVIVSPGATLTVYNQLYNDKVEGIMIQADETESASVIASTRSGGGTERVQVHLDRDGDGWHNVSSPVTQTIQDFLSENLNIPEKAGDRGMVPYNTAADNWDAFFTNSTSGDIGTAKGYLLRSNPAGLVEFNGTIRTGTQSTSITAGGNGWNLIGNPYSSAIYANISAGTNNFLTVNGGTLDFSYDAIYIWDGNEYYPINEARADFTEFIAAGQGFFVKAASDATVYFDPEMQVHMPTEVLKSGVITPEVRLSLSNATKSYSTRIAFLKDATIGLDKGYDAGILKADKNFSIFTHLVEDNNVEFTLQCLPLPKSDGMIIPVGIDCKAGGDVTISLSATTVPANYDLVLEDRLLNKFIPFNEANSFYTATLAAETKGIGRFYLHVKSAQTTGIDNLTDAKINAWMDRDEIVVKGVTENNAVAKLFDARGSLILMKNLENTNTNRIKVNGINTGIYMLQVIENGKRTTSKLQISGN